MSYATVADVDALDGAIHYTARTSVTDDDVAGFCVQTGAELDGILAALDYAVPVPASATRSFELMRLYNSYGADALAQQAWPDSPRRKSSMDLWKMTLKMLREATVQLPDAPRATDEGRVRVRSHASPIFSRDMKL